LGKLAVHCCIHGLRMLDEYLCQQVLIGSNMTAELERNLGNVVEDGDLFLVLPDPQRFPEGADMGKNALLLIHLDAGTRCQLGPRSWIWTWARQF